MSYQVIARKWRPQTFDEVTGQEVITHTLRNAIEHDRLHHAYLFSGARGVGKTTTARILAKSLNCHKTAVPNLTPCSAADSAMCPSCLEISESRSIDVLEIDAASHTGIDDVRETIIENISFNPARDRFKIFIIDEVHQLSKPAFNALLKTLEEPPPNVVFVMATTELHKVPDTIASRCQEFQFRTIPLQKIYDRLRLIADAEKIDISDDALREIARSGEGSMRDAQSNFDQVISFSGEKITSADVSNALGFAGVEILTRIVTAISARDPKEILTVVDDLVARGHDLRNFCRDLLGVFRDMLVFKVAGSDEKFFETAVIDADEMARLAEGFTESDVLRFFNSVAETEIRLKEASHSRYVLEIGLVKLIEMRRVEQVETLLKRLDAIERKASAAGNAALASLPAGEEKKTLNIAPAAKKPVPEAPTIAEPDILPEPEFAIEPPVGFFGDPPDESPFESYEPLAEIPDPPPAKRAAASFDPSKMPVRLPPIASEDLEHIDDKVLDGDFEEKLMLGGDDLMPLANSAKLIEKLLGGVVVTGHGPAGQGASAAAAPAYDISSVIPDPEPENGPVELPVLSSDPNEDELLAYANAHPTVQRVLRIFRGKIVGVTAAGPKSGT